MSHFFVAAENQKKREVRVVIKIRDKKELYNSNDSKLCLTMFTYRVLNGVELDEDEHLVVSLRFLSQAQLCSVAA